MDITFIQCLRSLLLDVHNTKLTQVHNHFILVFRCVDFLSSCNDLFFLTIFVVVGLCFGLVYGLLAPLKQRYNTTQLTHRTTVKVLIGQVIEESQ